MRRLLAVAIVIVLVWGALACWQEHNKTYYTYQYTASVQRKIGFHNVWIKAEKCNVEGYKYKALEWSYAKFPNCKELDGTYAHFSTGYPQFLFGPRQELAWVVYVPPDER